MLCPYCERAVIQDFQFDIEGRADIPDDKALTLFVCIGCGGTSVIEGETLRLPSFEEVEEIKGDPQIWEPIASHLATLNLKAFTGWLLPTREPNE